MFRIFKRKSKYFCKHRPPDDPQYWECTHMTRAGKLYTHTTRRFLTVDEVRTALGLDK